MAAPSRRVAAVSCCCFQTCVCNNCSSFCSIQSGSAYQQKQLQHNAAQVCYSTLQPQLSACPPGDPPFTAPRKRQRWLKATCIECRSMHCKRYVELLLCVQPFPPKKVSKRRAHVIWHLSKAFWSALGSVKCISGLVRVISVMLTLQWLYNFRGCVLLISFGMQSTL